MAAPSPFITDAQLKTVVANSLKTATTKLTLTSYWDTIITEQNQAAADEIRARLLVRGFTSAQVEAWDRAATFNKMIGLYWCLVEGGCLDNFSDLFIEKLRKDFLDALDTVAVLNSGVLQTPAEINFGPIDNTNDLFGNVYDQDDPRIGEDPTHF